MQKLINPNRVFSSIYYVVISHKTCKGLGSEIQKKSFQKSFEYQPVIAKKHCDISIRSISVYFHNDNVVSLHASTRFNEIVFISQLDIHM